jgi:hypothetical protein
LDVMVTWTISPMPAMIQFLRAESTTALIRGLGE